MTRQEACVVMCQRKELVKNTNMKIANKKYQKQKNRAGHAEGENEIKRKWRPFFPPKTKYHIMYIKTHKYLLHFPQTAVVSLQANLPLLQKD